jgi:hypothetical protein
MSERAHGWWTAGSTRAASKPVQAACSTQFATATYGILDRNYVQQELIVERARGSADGLVQA